MIICEFVIVRAVERGTNGRGAKMVDSRRRGAHFLLSASNENAATSERAC